MGAKYEEIILKDVSSAQYERNRKWVWRIYFGVLCIFAVLYFFLFHRALPGHIKFFIRAYEWSLTVDKGHPVRSMIYIHQYFLLFTVFVAVFLILLVLGFLAYDMQARNRIIQRLIKKDPNG